MDLPLDEKNSLRSQKTSQLRWDRRRKRFIESKATRQSSGQTIRTEGGTLIPATYDSGRFKSWHAQRRHNSVRPVLEKRYNKVCVLRKWIARNIY